MASDVKRKTCFVVAPYELPLGNFLESLRKEQIEPFFISDLLKFGRLAISNIRSAFRSVDLVIALLVDGHSLDNVFFEIGVAIGLGRPVMLFATSSLRLPSDLAGFEVNYVDLSNLENTIPIIKKSLEKKVRDEVVSFARSDARSDRMPPRLTGLMLRNTVQNIRNIWSHSRDPVQLEAELSKLLTDIGWTVVEARSSVRDRAPDLAVWIDEVQKEVGNPLAVEIKSSLRAADLSRVVSQLSRYLSSGGAKAGIIFYGGPELSLDRNVAQSSPPIFAFSFDQLADLIEVEKFPAALKSSLAAAKRIA
jgi:hypothetical protein